MFLGIYWLACVCYTVEYGTGASGLNSAPGDNSDQQWLQHMGKDSLKL